MFMTFKNKNNGILHFWLVELRFAILFLLNALYLMYFERIFCY
jgi:hypothetical protein